MGVTFFDKLQHRPAHCLGDELELTIFGILRLLTEINDNMKAVRGTSQAVFLSTCSAGSFSIPFSGYKTHQ